MSSSSTEKENKKRFFKHRRNAPSYKCSTPVRKGVRIPSNTSISEINTSSSGNIIEQKKKKKGLKENFEQKENTRQKRVKKLKKKRKPSLRTEISEEWETTKEILRESSMRKTISETRNVFGDAGSSKDIPQSPQIAENDVFNNLESPEKTRRDINFIQDFSTSPILGSGTRSRRKRRSESPRRISFGEDEKNISTKKRKPSLRTEREATEEILQKSFIFESSDDAASGDVESPKSIQQYSQISENDVLFVDLQSPEKVRRSTYFIHDRLESPICVSRTRRISETPKGINYGQKEVSLSPKNLLPRLSDDDDDLSPALVLKRDNISRTYPGSKQLKTYNTNISYDRTVDAYSYMYFPVGNSEHLWDKFVSENYEKVKQYLAPPKDENRTSRPKRKTLREALYLSSSKISSENTKMQMPKMMFEKYDKNMNVVTGVLDMSSGKWKRNYMYISSESDEDFNEAIKKGISRNKFQTKKRTSKAHALSSKESDLSKPVIMDSDYGQLASNEKKTIYPHDDEVSLASTSEDAKKSDQSKFSSKRMRKDREVGGTEMRKNKLSEIRKKPIISSIVKL